MIEDTTSVSSARTATSWSDIQAPSKITNMILRWFGKNRMDYPWRESCDPYRIWISEIMLQQTTIPAVLPVYKKFIAKFPTVEALASASEAEALTYCQGLGYYRRFRFMHKAAEQIAAEQNGFPKTYSEILKLPGVGAYTAAAVASMAFNEAHAAVDGNVERVICRICDIRSPISDKRVKEFVHQMSRKMISLHHPGDYNQAMMELGQIHCRKVAQCQGCPLQSKCLAFVRNSQDLAPAKVVQKKPISVHMRILAIMNTHTSEYVLLRRPEKARFLKSHLGFFTFIKGKSRFHSDGNELTWNDLVQMNRGLNGKKTAVPKSCGMFSHAITNHKITVEVYAWKIKGKLNSERLLKQFEKAQQTSQGLGLQTLRAEALSKQLVTGLDLKAWDLIKKHLAKNDKRSL